MSMQLQEGAPEPEGAGFPELNELGRKLEVLRIQRGISKQHLARYAATSRQQLWRVMTGKSELTSSLKERLAQALGVEPGELSAAAGTLDVRSGSGGATLAGGLAPAGAARSTTTLTSAAGRAAMPASPTPVLLADYLADPSHLLRTLATLPTGGDGIRLKRLLMNALEDLALERSLTLPADFFETRRRVLAAEL